MVVSKPVVQINRPKSDRASGPNVIRLFDEFLVVTRAKGPENRPSDLLPIVPPAYFFSRGLGSRMLFAKVCFFSQNGGEYNNAVTRF